MVGSDRMHALLYIVRALGMRGGELNIMFLFVGI